MLAECLGKHRGWTWVVDLVLTGAGGWATFLYCEVCGAQLRDASRHWVKADCLALVLSVGSCCPPPPPPLLGLRISSLVLTSVPSTHKLNPQLTTLDWGW